MNILNFTFAASLALLSCGFCAESDGTLSVKNQNPPNQNPHPPSVNPPSFYLDLPTACSDTLTKDKFLVALRTAVAAADSLKLAALLHCPQTYARIAELTDADVRIQDTEIPDILRAEFQKLLEQLQFGTLQTDNDQSFIGCIDHIKTLLPNPDICADKDKLICSSTDLDHFFLDTQKGEPCTRELIKDEIIRMVNVVKANRGLMSAVDTMPRSELINDLQAILDAAPYKKVAEMAPKDLVKEQVELSARSKIEELLGIKQQKATIPESQQAPIPKVDPPIGNENIHSEPIIN